MTQLPEMATTPPVYTMRRTLHGYIAAIERQGYTVLQLQDGSVRNEEEAAGIVDRLNRTVTSKQVESILPAVMAKAVSAGLIPQPPSDDYLWRYDAMLEVVKFAIQEWQKDP